MNNFADYMFHLLFAPLKKVGKKKNQFYIFFKVVGRSFDALKRQVLQVREEGSVLTCSDSMLPVHGADRDMPRLRGETLENYRTRLAMKGAIAAQAGTCAGIRNLARSFGYDNVEVTSSTGPDHWAEATVLFIGGKVVLDDREILLQELNKIKPARTLLTLSKEQQYQASPYLASAKVVGREITIRQE